MSNSGKYSAVVDEDSEAEYVFDVDEEEEDEDGAMRIELDEITPHNVTTGSSTPRTESGIVVGTWSPHVARAKRKHRDRRGAKLPNFFSQCLSCNRAFTSLVSVYIIEFLGTFMFSIFLPTLPGYLKNAFHMSTLFYGTCSASFNAAALIMSPIVGYWSGRRRISEPIYFCGSISVIAFLLYATVRNKWAVLISRILAGAGANLVTLGNAYVAMVSTPESRTKHMTGITASATLGFLFGTVAAVICGYANFHMGHVLVDQYASVGWLCAIASVFNMVQLFLLFREPSSALKHPSFQKTEMPDAGNEMEGAREPSTKTLHMIEESDADETAPLYVRIINTVWFFVVSIDNLVGALAWMVAWFAASGSWQLYETVISRFLEDEYDWTQQVISATWVVISACTIIVIVAFNQLSVGRVAGRPVLFYAFWMLFMFSFGLLLYYGPFKSGVVTLPKWQCAVLTYVVQYWVSAVNVSLGFTMERIITITCFSDVLPPGYQGTMMGFFQAVGRLATIAFSPVGGKLYAWSLERKIYCNPVWICSLSLLSIPPLLSFVLFRKMFPKDNLQAIVSDSHSGGYDSVELPEIQVTIEGESEGERRLRDGDDRDNLDDFRTKDTPEGKDHKANIRTKSVGNSREELNSLHKLEEKVDEFYEDDDNDDGVLEFEVHNSPARFRKSWR